ncbi:Pericentriolar material 1 protein [Eumeta japonica]|uniref:Pericentriolar material 1 protein n=1 Tax=Eumeta variegata TaxID=151549 RepID=A0A4C1VCX0_EUMVA|nr:Pericentriolar material 1 protein [Eumeta japonica]
MFPQEVVTPTRRDMSSNLVTTSLDWVPVPEYNSRGNYTQSRKTSNNTSDQEYADLDNPNSFETGFGRFVPVRPQPRVLPLNPQHRDPIVVEHSDENVGASSSYALHPYPHPVPNGIGPHSNHTPAAVMIVNPTTPNAMSVNMSQPFNTTVNSNRKNLIRNLNTARNNFDGSSNNIMSNNNLTSNSRTATKTVNLMNNVYDTAGSSNNLNETNQAHRESARALGEAIVAACPDATAVERRLGQIREYIRVTSSLVDTMRNSEDEAYIEHTKEEYDELVQMVMKLRESESKLERMLSGTETENQEVIADEQDVSITDCFVSCAAPVHTDENNKENVVETNPNTDSSNSSFSRKVNNIENEQMNKSLHNDKVIDRDNNSFTFPTDESEHGSTVISETVNLRENDNKVQPTYQIDIQELETIPYNDLDSSDKDDNDLNEMLKRNIVSCSEKLAFIEEIKCKNVEINKDNQDVVIRPVSSQSMGSGYSENELWQNEIKNKMEISQQRLAALQQQQKRLLKYKAEAKQQLAEINHARQIQEMAAASHDNLTNIQNQSVSSNYSVYPRLYAANQIGVATTLPHSADMNHRQGIGVSQTMTSDDVLGTNNRESNDPNTNVSSHEDRFSHRDVNLTNSEGTGAHNSESDDDDALNARARQLTMELQEIRAKKKHMESLVNEFQKIHMTTHMVGSHNTYSSSGEDSPDEQPTHKCNKSDPNINNDDPFKLMEIKAIKTALQKTKDHELNIASLQELAQQLRMETEKIMDERARLKQAVSNKEFTRKHKKINEDVRPSTSGIPGPVERRQMELRALLAEKQKQLEALLNKEKALSTTIEEHKVQTDTQPISAVNQAYNSEQEQCSQSQQVVMETQSASGPENFRVSGDNVYIERAHQNTQPQHSSSNYASDSDNAVQNKSNQRSRCRRRQTHDRQFEDAFENMVVPSINTSQNTMRSEHRGEPSIPNVMSPSQGENGSSNTLYPNVPQQTWTSSKINQDMRTNQFTQNSHSQTMDRLLGTPQLSYPPSIPFNVMMPYGMMGGCACACGCALWAAGCWQQLVLQQRELHQLRDQVNHLEERWRAENASHMLNNQVPPGNRANNYWDNFRSYSRQNLLSTNNKTNSDGHLGVGQAHNPHPLVERSHNALHCPTTGQPHPPAISVIPKRNTDTTPAANNTLDEARHARRNISYDRSLSFSSAPDVLNVNQTNEHEIITNCPGLASSVQSPARPIDDAVASNINLNRQETSNPFRNLNISNTIPEIVQSHANNLNSSTDSINTKKKSSSKLPAKNSANRRHANCSLDYVQISNINIAGTSESHNPNLASTTHDVDDKATSKLFDLLRENVYTEVTALIGVNESHPDFLIQLFKELQLISSDTLRQKVLQSIRSVLSQYSSLANRQNNENLPNDADRERIESVPAGLNEPSNIQNIDYSTLNGCMNGIIDSNIVRFLMSKNDEICTSELLETLTALIIDSVPDNCQPRYSKKHLLRYLSKYEGARLQDVSSDIIDNLSEIIAENGDEEESSRRADEAESAMLQDVAGSLSLFSSDGQLHSCPYELWPAHVHVEMDSDARATAVEVREAAHDHEGAVDLISCSEMHNGELAEADQTCRTDTEPEGAAGTEALPDLVETEEATPTEAEAEWFGLDRVPTRLHMGESPESQKNDINTQ